MAVSRKGRRPMSVRGKTYFWECRTERSRDPSHKSGPVVMIIGEDAQLHVRYHLFQRDDRRYATVSGAEFSNIELHGTQNVRCPHFGWVASPVVWPSTVREILDWCHASRAKRQLVDDEGLDLPDDGSHGAPPR